MYIDRMGAAQGLPFILTFTSLCACRLPEQANLTRSKVHHGESGGYCLKSKKAIKTESSMCNAQAGASISDPCSRNGIGKKTLASVI